MTYPNAYKGIEKLHLAEILLIVGTIITSVALFFVSKDGMNLNIESLSNVVLIIILAGIIIGNIIIVYSNILNLIGLKIASKDARIFIVPFILSIVLIALQIVLSIVIVFMGKEGGEEIVEFAEEIVELVQMILVIIGSSRLAKTLNGTNFVKVSRINLFLIVIMLVFSLLAGVFSVFTEDLYNVFVVISNVLELVSFVIYLVYIDRIIKFLEKN